MAFNSITDAVAQFKSSDNEILFVHIREPEEIQRTASIFKAKTLLVKRVGLSNILTNCSDANVDNYPYDYIIENTTLEELDSNALYFVNQIKNNEPKEIIKCLRDVGND